MATFVEEDLASSQLATIKAHRSNELSYVLHPEKEWIWIKHIHKKWDDQEALVWGREGCDSRELVSQRRAAAIEEEEEKERERSWGEVQRRRQVWPTVENHRGGEHFI